MKTDKADVVLSYKEKDGKYEWYMATDPAKYPDGPGKYGKLTVDKGNDGVFTFAIKTKDINFDPTNPIQVSLAPGSSGPDNSQQFTHTFLAPNKLQLSDGNIDSQATDYYYKLNFNNQSSLDPIIQNGCCRTNKQSDMAFLAIGAVAVLALFLLVIRPMLARRAAAGPSVRQTKDHDGL